MYFFIITSADFRYTRQLLNEENSAENEDALGKRNEATSSQLLQTHKGPLYKLQTRSLTPDLVR